MSNVVILGAQWGDEGKGKIVDFLTEDVDIVARYQGGPNAGHTVVINKETFILHMIPSGIFHEGKLCIIGNGVVINPAGLIKEIEGLKEKAFNIEGRLLISKYAHLIMPYHIAIEKEAEKNKGEKKIGTTLRGIGPAYTDKIARNGIRVADLMDRATLSEKVEENLKNINFLLEHMYNADPLDGREIVEEYLRYGDVLSSYIADTTYVINNELSNGKKVLFEGAQGTLLDVDHGTYPYVTSSNATVGGAFTGLGVGPKAVDEVIGIVKAYTTRVGSGPFPTEIKDELGEEIRQKGHEFGSTTGRPRRCGWLDAVALKYAATINNFTGIAITKLDVLDSLDVIKVCIAYKNKGEFLEYMPRETNILNSCEPVYK
ncbi:MAG: adenylosuccinate synthase, partial [Nitrospirae bacterium]